MLGYRFEPGMHFIQQNREFVVEQYLTEDELQVKEVATNEFTAKPISLLLTALFEGDLILLGDNRNYQFLQQKLAKSRGSDFSLLDKNDPRKIEARRRLEYVKEIKKRGLTTYTQKSLKPVIHALHKKIRDKKKKPHWSTVNRWRKAYEAAGDDFRALVSAEKARGNANHKYSGICLSEFSEEDIERANAVANIVEKLVRTQYLTKQRRTVASVHRMIEVCVTEDNKRRNDRDQLPVPDLSSIYRYIETLDPYVVDLARYGKRYADQKHRTHQQGPRPTRPMQRVQADHTRTNLMVVDTKTRLPLGRPWLTTLIDLDSKLIIGFYISFTPPSYLSVMQCLLHAIRPKTYVGKLYPKIEHTWDAYGIPEVIVVDNGKEFYSEEFEDACLQLGIEIEYAPRRAPWYKGSMERFYRTIETELYHELPGTTFSGILDKLDYDPAKHALISIDATLEVTHIWIVDIYSQSLHRGITDVPARKWKEGIKEWPPSVPPKKEDLQILLGYKEQRSISNSGIEFKSLFYNCKELGMIRRKLKPKEKVVIKYDPNDISIIYVYDKGNDCYLPVPALDQEYTKGLTLWQHLVIKNYARKIAESHVDRDALCRAKRHLQTIVEREILTTKKLAGSEKIARYLNLGQPNYVELIEEQQEEGTEHVLKNGEDERVEKQGQVSVGSSLNNISDVGEAFISPQGVSTKSSAEILNIREEDFQEYAGDVSAVEDEANTKRPQSIDRSEGRYETSKPLKSAGAKRPESASANGASLIHDIDELNEEDWGADYDLPL
jgi:putative transposase